VKKSHALEVGATVLGTRWHGDHEGDKKAELAKALEAAFAGDAATTLGLDPETSARAGAWVPPGMAYGATHDHEPPSGAGEVDRSDAGSGSACGDGSCSSGR
jgi:hypothetical protein